MHPGEVLREDLLPHHEMTPDQLAQRLGVAPAEIADLISERRRLDARMAAKLGDVFALCPRYWLALQLQYDLWQKTMGADGGRSVSAPETLAH